jgi:hypothetical protein
MWGFDAVLVLRKEKRLRAEALPWYFPEIAQSKVPWRTRDKLEGLDFIDYTLSNC